MYKTDKSPMQEAAERAGILSPERYSQLKNAWRMGADLSPIDYEQIRAYETSIAERTETKPEMSLEKRIILDAIKRALAIFETCQFTDCDKCQLNRRHFGDMPICSSLTGAGKSMLERGL